MSPIDRMFETLLVGASATVLLVIAVTGFIEMITHPVVFFEYLSLTVCFLLVSAVVGYVITSVWFKDWHILEKLQK